MIYKRAIVACLVGVLYGCVASEPDPTATDPTAAAAEDDTRVKAPVVDVERINNPVFEGNIIRFSALSNGCTTSTDFVVEHAVQAGACELTVLRTKPDYCRKASALIDIELEWSLPANCAGLDIVFTNPEFGNLTHNQPVRSLERKIENAAPED